MEEPIAVIPDLEKDQSEWHNDFVSWLESLADEDHIDISDVQIHH